jgi:hypothetical protein
MLSLQRPRQVSFIAGRQGMSDFLLIRGIDANAARPLFDGWKANRKWVRSVELRDAWEQQQLTINGRDAVVFMAGKHKADLAELVLLLQAHGGRVIHLMLHRSTADRIEEDLGEWASRRSKRYT